MSPGGEEVTRLPCENLAAIIASSTCKGRSCDNQVTATHVDVSIHWTGLSKLGLCLCSVGRNRGNTYVCKMSEMFWDLIVVALHGNYA